MGIVMIKCPRTGHEIATGITMDRSDFARAPVFFARTYCPICAAEHEWFAQDAWVCDRPGCSASARDMRAAAEPAM